MNKFLNQEKPLEKVLNNDEVQLATNSTEDIHDRDEFNEHGNKGAVSLYIATSLIHLS